MCPGVTWAADSSATEEGQTLDVRHLSPEQRRRLLAGDTIAYQVLETSETEIGAGVAMYLSVPLGRAAEVLTSPDVVLKDPSITSSGLIPAPATAAALQGFKLASGEMGEARDVLEAEAGLRFNFTLAESEATCVVYGMPAEAVAKLKALVDARNAFVMDTLLQEVARSGTAATTMPTFSEQAS